MTVEFVLLLEIMLALSEREKERMRVRDNRRTAGQVNDGTVER